MGTIQKREGGDGFAVLEVVLILVIVAGVIGAGAYVYSKHHKMGTNTAASTMTSSTSASTQAVPLNGTTSSVSSLTQQEVSSETSSDSSLDAQNQQSATNVNAAANNVGGAYNENNL